MKLRLFHYWRSGSSWRVRMALAFKGIECEFVPINLLTDESDSPEHRARNPMGYVPVLEIIETTEGKAPRPELRHLGESSAIIEWLEETHPTPAFLPLDPLERAHVRHLAQLVNSGIQPLQNPNVTALHSSDPAEQKKWAQTWIRKGLGSYETLVQGKAGRFSFGDTLGYADFFLIPQCYAALRFDVDLAEFPTVKRIYEAALETDEGKASHPDRFKPA